MPLRINKRSGKDLSFSVHNSETMAAIAFKLPGVVQLSNSLSDLTKLATCAS